MSHGYINKHGDSAETARRAWGRFRDAIDEMAEGTDQDGPIAKDEDGTVWKFVFTFCENDYDMDAVHGLPNYKRAELFCKHCRATNFVVVVKNRHPHSDLRPAASWKRNLVTSNAEFKRRLVRRHPLTDSKYFNK